MDRQHAEKTMTEYLKPIFGFALKRCKSMEDAEDLSQEIIAKAFRVLLIKDDILDMRSFIWTIAHHALGNYYRDTARSGIGISIDEMADEIADPHSEIGSDDNMEAIKRLQIEIAHLSKLQRTIIIAYYFENRKQADISRAMGIPLGTVKWHLFEAKRELKRGMDAMRKTSELKFNPIKFQSYGFNGKPGTKAPEEFFRCALSQNICYCVRNTAKTVNEIADALGVSPVYVESEAEFLEEYGFLLLQKGRYIANFMISEPADELLASQNDITQSAMYRQAAELFANELYDELTGSGVLDNPDIRCWQTDGTLSLTEDKPADRNFVLWTLIPYIAACSGGNRDERIPFEAVATIRPDGGCNTFHATVVPEVRNTPDGKTASAGDPYRMNWSGPLWNEDGIYTLWQFDSEWSDRDAPGGTQYPEEARRVISLYDREYRTGTCLSKDEYAWLAQRGYVKTYGDPDGLFKSVWQMVALGSKNIQKKLLNIGWKIREKHREALDALESSYAKAVLESVPTHLRKVEEYELQFLFSSNGYFLVHCMRSLMENGKLWEPAKGQRKILTTLMIENR